MSTRYRLCKSTDEDIIHIKLLVHWCLCVITYIFDMTLLQKLFIMHLYIKKSIISKTWFRKFGVYLQRMQSGMLTEHQYKRCNKDTTQQTRFNSLRSWWKNMSIDLIQLFCWHQHVKESWRERGNLWSTYKEFTNNVSKYSFKMLPVSVGALGTIPNITKESLKKMKFWNKWACTILSEERQKCVKRLWNSQKVDVWYW